MALLIFSEKTGPAQVIELHGALDTAAAPKLEARVMETIDAGHTLLIFNLEKLTFVSSAGLTVFLLAFRRLQGHGSVRFAAMRPEVRTVFNITGLATRVEIYDSVTEALVGPMPDR